MSYINYIQILKENIEYYTNNPLGIDGRTAYYRHRTKEEDKFCSIGRMVTPKGFRDVNWVGSISKINRDIYYLTHGSMQGYKHQNMVKHHMFENYQNLDLYGLIYLQKFHDVLLTDIENPESDKACIYGKTYEEALHILWPKAVEEFYKSLIWASDRDLEVKVEYKRKMLDDNFHNNDIDEMIDKGILVNYPNVYSNDFKHLYWAFSYLLSEIE